MHIYYDAEGLDSLSWPELYKKWIFINTQANFTIFKRGILQIFDYQKMKISLSSVDVYLSIVHNNYKITSV